MSKVPKSPAWDRSTSYDEFERQAAYITTEREKYRAAEFRDKSLHAEKTARRMHTQCVQKIKVAFAAMLESARNRPGLTLDEFGDHVMAELETYHEGSNKWRANLSREPVSRTDLYAWAMRSPAPEFNPALFTSGDDI